MMLQKLTQSCVASLTHGRSVLGVMSGGPQREAPTATTVQARFKPHQPLKWPNDKVMRAGTRNMMQPWELRSDPDIVVGDFGLIAAKGGHITERQLENAMTTIKTNIRIKDYNITVKDDLQLLPMSVRPQGARMGKGLGDNVQWVMKVRAGTVLFDVEARWKAVISDEALKQFFFPIQHMLGVRTMPVRHGVVNSLDDLTYDSAVPYMDANYCRRMQDVYPDLRHKQHYRHHAHAIPDAPYWNVRREQLPWFPVHAGSQWPERNARWTEFETR